MRNCLLIFFLMFGQASLAQGNTLGRMEGGKPYRASLEEVAWLAGHWRGEALGGIAEEIWSPPLGGSMMFSFKLVVNGQVSFYELGYIKEAGQSLILQLKHFDNMLHGWEEKENTVDFPLVKVEGNRVYFEDLTFEKVNEETMNVYLIIGGKEGEREVMFRYSKYKA